MEPDKKMKPQTDTDFGDEEFDTTPIRAGRFSGWNEKIFSLMRPKKPNRQDSLQNQPIPTRIRPGHPAGGIFNTVTPDPDTVIPEGYEVQNGLLLTKKTLAERVRDQLRFPVIKNIPTMTSGLALIIFAVGAYLLYSALPTRPDLILGIILVSAAGNILMNR